MKAVTITKQDNKIAVVFKEGSIHFGWMFTTQGALEFAAKLIKAALEIEDKEKE